MQCTRCSCNSAGLSRTDYCKYVGGDICCSPFISKQMDIEDDEGETMVSMMNKYTLYFLVIYSVYTCISKWLTNKFKFTYVLFP